MKGITDNHIPDIGKYIDKINEVSIPEPPFHLGEPYGYFINTKPHSTNEVIVKDSGYHFGGTVNVFVEKEKK